MVTKHWNYCRFPPFFSCKISHRVLNLVTNLFLAILKNKNFSLKERMKTTIIPKLYGTAVMKSYGLIYCLTNELAWEPSTAQVTHSYFRRLPALGLKLQF